MPPVSTHTAPIGTGQNAWTCPTCRHGSPDPRDELAHLDAHRQLGQFFQEWDAAVAEDRGRRRVVGPLAAVLTALVAAVTLMAGVLFWTLGGRSGDARPAPRPAADVPVDPAPSLAGPATPAPEPPPAPEPAPERPEPVATVASPAPEAPAPSPRRAAAPAAGDAGEPVPAAAEPVSPVDEPVAPVAAPPAPTFSAAPEPTAVAPAPTTQSSGHLIELCLLGICLGVA